MSARFHQATSLALVLSLVVLPGCKAGAKDDDPTAFSANATAKMTEQDELPFNNAWLAPGWNGPERTSIVIRPVDTKLVRQSDWYKKASEKGKVAGFDKDLGELAAFTREEFQKAFREDGKKRFSVVSQPNTSSLVFELAIVDVEPNRKALGVVGLAALVIAAPIGLGILAKEGAKGGIAIEGRIKDSQGNVVGMFQDREKGKFAPVNVARATSFGEVQKSIREWAEQWVKVSNADAGQKVKDSKTFTLRPW
ncbi:MAG: DUF3313 family protein [Deltaproteobacteria bacterium]|nr:DUF3313 family protein [Deltaproteobacteria bacterium]